MAPDTQAGGRSGKLGQRESSQIGSLHIVVGWDEKQGQPLEIEGGLPLVSDFPVVTASGGRGRRDGSTISQAPRSG